MAKVGIEKLEELFVHLPQENLFDGLPSLPDELSYEDTVLRLLEVSSKTNLLPSFIGDLLPVWNIHPIVNDISQLRPLTTSYTPYNQNAVKAHLSPTGFTNACYRH